MGIRIDGEGDCAQLRVSWGDGISTDLRSIQNWPLWIQHPYAPTAAGVKTIEAKGVRDCSGAASVALSVAPRPGYTPPPAGSPRIDAVHGTVTPGGNILVMGSGFGETSTWVVVASSELPAGGLGLAILEWRDHYILGTTPMVTGVKDHNAAVKLQRAGYSGPGGGEPPAESNAYPVSFKAAREVIKLPSKDLRVTRCDRGAAWVELECLHFADDVVGATHGGGLLGASGQDHYKGPTLANGWAYDKLVINMDRRGGLLITTEKPSSDGKIELSWSVNPLGDISYTLSVSIVGPKGVPYR